MEGKVIIHKQAEPNKQGFAFYMTGKRTVITNWDEDGNYISEGIKTEEDIRNRFNKIEDAISYAEENNYSYMIM